MHTVNTAKSVERRTKSVNRGKDFEASLRKQLEKVFDVTRIADNTAGYMGGRNICDFIAYSFPHLYYLELKSTKGNTLPFSNITDTQFSGLLEKERVLGVGAGYIIWFLEKDKTFFVSAGLANTLRMGGAKSIHINALEELSSQDMRCYELEGTKKRVFFDYNIEKLEESLEEYVKYGKRNN